MSFDGSPIPDSADGRWSLEAELARERRDLAALAPVLRHLVASEDNALLGEEAVARTRGLIESLALELLRAAAEDHAAADLARLTEALVDRAPLLGHCHALALEGQITGRLAERGVDPLLPPLLQARTGDPDPATAALAMDVMAAQTRFVRRHQRMELALGELPGDLMHLALGAAADVLGPEAHPALDQLRARFAEGASRIALLAQLGLGLGDDFSAGLDPARGGFALFATALSLVTGQARDAVVLACAERQEARLALLLAVAGLSALAREGAILCLHPDSAPAPDWFTIGAPDAADLLLQGAEG